MKNENSEEVGLYLAQLIVARENVDAEVEPLLDEQLWAFLSTESGAADAVARLSAKEDFEYDNAYGESIRWRTISVNGPFPLGPISRLEQGVE